ncbi:hypothetical protein Tco_0410647 [Tanacetum coccineum]
MNTRLIIKKLDRNIVQKHGGSKQVGFKQLGLGVEIGVHRVHDEKRIWFEVELHGAQRDREAGVFQVTNDDTVVAHRRLKDKQPEEKKNTDCLVKEQEKEYQTGWKIKTGIQQQNRLVDETNVTFFDKVHCFLIQSGQSNILWAEDTTRISEAHTSIEKWFSKGLVLCWFKSSVMIIRPNFMTVERRLKDKQPEEKTNTDCLVKEQEKEYQTGWKIKTGVVWIQQQNRLVDETNVTFFDKVHCFLIQSGQSNILWAEDTTRSTYLVNRSPSLAIRFKKPIDMLEFFGWLASIKHGMFEPVVFYKNMGFNESGEYKKTFIGFGVARDRDQHLACELFGYREESNEATFTVVAVEKIYSHESLTFNNTVACEAEICAIKVLLDKAKRNVLGMEIVRDQSGNTLRMSYSRFYNKKMVQTLLEGHFILSLEGSLSGDCDVEKNDVGMLDKFDRGLQTDVQHIEALLTTEAGYMTFTKAWKKEIWLKGLLTESRYKLRVGVAPLMSPWQDETSEPQLYVGWMVGPYQCEDAMRGRNDDPVRSGTRAKSDRGGPKQNRSSCSPKKFLKVLAAKSCCMLDLMSSERSKAKSFEGCRSSLRMTMHEAVHEMVVRECYEPNSKRSGVTWKAYMNVRVAGLFLLVLLEYPNERIALDDDDVIDVSSLDSRSFQEGKAMD